MPPTPMVPVRAGAKNPRTFRPSLRMVADARTQMYLRKLGGARSALPRAVAGGLNAAGQKAVHQARSNLRRKYHWRGRSGASIKVADYGVGARGRKPFISIRPSPDEIAESPTFGRWAQDRFSVPTGLHEGIKRHRVFLRYGAWERKGLIAWARAHGIPEPPRGKNWAMMVYSGSRAGNAEPFLADAVRAKHDDATFSNHIFGAINDVLSVGGSARGGFFGRVRALFGRH